MAKQRLRGEGSISYSNGRGKWIARVWNPLTQRYIHSYVDTQREALARIKELQRKEN